MTARPNDPLLLAGRVLIVLCQGIVALAGLALAVGLPIVLFMRDQITAEMREEFATPDIVFPMLPVAGVVLLGAAILALAFLFLNDLRRVIDTVGQGDPFAPVNAERLTRMGWFALAAQVMAIPASGLALLAAKLMEDQGNFTVDAGLSLTGVILVVILFILARVFRHGAAMRADLEGTV